MSVNPTAPEILVVDDEDDIRLLISGILQDEGYATREAATGEAALEQVKTLYREVIEGKSFANLHQIYHWMILATWYKCTIKKIILTKMFVNRNLVGVMNLANLNKLHRGIPQGRKVTARTGTLLLLGISLMGCSGTRLAHFIDHAPSEPPVITQSKFSGLVFGIDEGVIPQSWDHRMTNYEISMQNRLIRWEMWKRDYLIISFAADKLPDGANRIYNNGDPATFVGRVANNGDDYTVEKDQRSLYIKGELIIQVVKVDGIEDPRINIVDPYHRKVWMHQDPNTVDEIIVSTAKMKKLNLKEIEKDFNS